MSDQATPLLENPVFIPALLGVLLFLQLVLLIAVFNLSGKVSRLMRWAASKENRVPDAGDLRLAEQKEANSEQKHLFASFLAEDPARRELPKKEQFAEFRRWREEKGLNWKNPGESA